MMQTTTREKNVAELLMVEMQRTNQVIGRGTFGGQFTIDKQPEQLAGGTQVQVRKLG